MRPRTFILVISIFVLLAIAAVLYFVYRSNNLLGGGAASTTVSTDGTPSGGDQAPIEPPPTATPAVFLQTVVVARLDLPLGTRLTEELLEVEERPNTNIALQGGYTFDNFDELIGQLIKVDIQKGDAILRPMIAIEASDLVSFGSDLSLYVDRGKVAVAFPLSSFTTPDLLAIEIANGVSSEDPGKDPAVIDRIAQEKGVAFAMRPGDFIDIMMTTEVVDIDPDFRTALPNSSEHVRFLAGVLFFLPKTAQGRLEFIPEINQVVEIIPSVSAGGAIPKRVTQLAIQQAEVLWVGTWFDRQKLEKLIIDAATNAANNQGVEGEPEADPTTTDQTTPEEFPSVPSRINSRPDVVVLSMSPQDALALKWSLEHGMDIDLALRAQGDTQNFTTSSVSLFQIIEQGGIVVQPPTDFDLSPHPSGVGIPVLLSSVLETEVSATDSEVIILLREAVSEPTN